MAKCRELLNQSSFQMLSSSNNVTAERKSLLVAKFTLDKGHFITGSHEVKEYPMMPGENEIRENLKDAGVSPSEAAPILECIRTGNIKGAEKLIGISRKKQLDLLHKSQRCIDTLDYLVYQIGK